MKKNIDFLRLLDKLIRALLVAILIVAIIIAFLLISYVNTPSESYAYEPQRLTFEEQLKHDKEISYQHYVSTQNTECQPADKGKYRIEVTQEDIDLMARVVMSEGSILSQEAKQAIATTIVNRVLVKSGEFATLNTVKEVVYHGKAYSTQDNGEPNETCYQAVYDALTYECFPLSMVWFRENDWHVYGYRYLQIGTTYFNTYEDMWE